MRLVALMASLLLILIPIVSYSYDFIGEDPICSKSAIEQTPSQNVTKDEPIVIEGMYISPEAMQILHNAVIQSMVDNIKQEEEIEVVEPPKTSEVIPVQDTFEGIKKTEDTLPDIEAPKLPDEDDVKVIIHSSTTCSYCPPYKQQAEKLKDKYNIEIVEHSYATKSKYGIWLNAFPITEVVKGDKLMGYRSGYMSSQQLEEFIKSKIK